MAFRLLEMWLKIQNNFLLLFTSPLSPTSLGGLKESITTSQETTGAQVVRV